MTKPMHRSRSKKRMMKRTPSGATKLRYKKGKHGHRECALCHYEVLGVGGRTSQVEVSRMSKSERSVTAPFGGHLCSSCRRNVFSQAAQVHSGEKRLEDVSFELKKYVESALKLA